MVLAAVEQAGVLHAVVHVAGVGGFVPCLEVLRARLGHLLEVREVHGVLHGVLRQLQALERVGGLMERLLHHVVPVLVAVHVRVLLLHVGQAVLRQRLTVKRREILLFHRAGKHAAVDAVGGVRHRGGLHLARLRRSEGMWRAVSEGASEVARSSQDPGGCARREARETGVGGSASARTIAPARTPATARPAPVVSGEMELAGEDGAGCLMATCGRLFGYEMKRRARQSRFRRNHGLKWRVSFRGKFRGRTCAVRFAGLPAGRRFFMGRDCMAERSVLRGSRVRPS